MQNAIERFYYDRPRFRSHATANAVETLRIKHWLARQAVHVLDGLFGMQMGLSVILLWVMAVFDIYYELYRDSPSKALIYGWLLQYSLRLTMIILMAHYTTKQVSCQKTCDRFFFWCKYILILSVPGKGD